MYNKALPFIHLLIIVSVEAGQGGVSFWRESFTMTCPGEGLWFQEGNKVNETLSKSHTVPYKIKRKGLYHCEYGPQGSTTTYYFYVEGKGCSDCYEMDASVMGLVIVADVSATAILMILIYKCTKKKNVPATKALGGPTPPPPDYEALNIHARSQDAYSFLNNTKSR
ncbi:T-cell surface glycoprotein CD3 epsilon chain-like [Dunckerocampus dactyliophorus]|uniref:T-cell surface glycoprotein CD3 epsilon chain-like n=1 Tax=Dunckerocampus dactyliophorus TaxID=161453 RepID=UPI002406D522|nr:T-cell surface glycoprotein CD3 epsilon chain-like [Dunckerocampus dactyliophorus]